MDFTTDVWVIIDEYETDCMRATSCVLGVYQSEQLAIGALYEEAKKHYGNVFKLGFTEPYACFVEPEEECNSNMYHTLKVQKATMFSK